MVKRPTWATELAENEAVLGHVRDRVLEGAALRAGHTVLDLGAGTGLLTFGALPLVYPGGKVVAIDQDPGCLDAVSRRALALGVLGGGIAVVAGTADAIPLAADAVDAVVVRSVLVYVADRPGAAREIARVLKTGGRLSLYEPLPGALGEEGSADWRPVWAVRLSLETLLAEQRENPRGRETAAFTAEGLSDALREAGLGVEAMSVASSAKAPTHDLARHFDLLKLPGNPTTDNPPWHARLRRSFSEADLRAYVEHAVAEARRGRYRIVLPALYLRATKPVASGR